MKFGQLYTWISHKIKGSETIKAATICYIIFIMTPQIKYSLKNAAIFSKSSKSRFSKFLKNNSEIATYNLKDLSKKQAKQFSKIMKYLGDGNLPWKIAILIDSTLHQRSSLYPENSQKLNHGKGYVIGHQWTNIVLVINDKLIPLQPIPFYTKKYCRENKIKYRTENEKVIEYITNLNLHDYVNSYNPDEVVVLADSGYDDRNIENAINKRQWKFIISLNKTRSVKTEKQFANTFKSKDWTQISELFKRYRCIRWITIQLLKNSGKNKRMEFRTRQIIGFLRYVGKVQLICSEFKKRPKGRRKYLACNDLKAKVRQIIIGYRIRWEIEIFHKKIKMHLGLQDVATTSFKSVISHVHLVYCAYILLTSHPPCIPKQINSIPEKQMVVQELINRKELSRMRQILTRINGKKHLENELQRVLEAPFGC